jgi:hypothetical protein
MKLTLAVSLTLVLSAGAAVAQDFGSASPPGPRESPCAFVEDGLPPASPVGAEVSFARWWGLPGLETRAIAGVAGLRSARIAAGLSQTGDPEIGWNTAALALGVARPAGGAGLRVLGRRDRTIAPGSDAAAHLESRAGLEVGGGAWLEAARGLRLWASVPQAWVGGAAPPMDRPLEIGGSYEYGEAEDGGDLLLWVTRGSPSGDSPADHGAGAALCSGPITAWALVRDRPLRGGIGLAARARGLLLATEVESHPDLGETVRLSAGWIWACR